MCGCFWLAVGYSGHQSGAESHHVSPSTGGRSLPPDSHRFSQNDAARSEAFAAHMQGRLVLGLAFVAGALVSQALVSYCHGEATAVQLSK